MASANKDHLRNPADNLEFAGDYHLPYVHLINHSGEGIDSDTHGENITALVIELNIYESIFSSSVTGNIVIADTQNLISKLPIQGTERLSFRLTTKLTGDTPTTVINCTEANGTAMHIYAVTDKQQINDNTLTYTLQFASREFVRNLRTRVSESFEGRMDQMVNKIFTDENYLDSQKTLHYQQTRNQDKIVVPNLNPFAAIGLMCQRALPDIYRSKGAGYLFYETTKGFHFRSWESLCVDKNGNPRDAKQQFRYVQANVVQDEEDRVIEGYKNVRSYKFTNNFHDVAANTALGTYGHRVITHNIYDKSYREDDYHYHNQYHTTAHTDGDDKDFHPAITSSPVDYDIVDDPNRSVNQQKGVSDWPESRVTVQPTTRFAHGDDTGNFGTDVINDGVLEGQRVSQINQIHSGTRLQMTIKGQSWLQPGDLIQFDIQSVQDRDIIAQLDPLYSGKYIITHIRHRVAVNEYIQVIECAKDGFASPVRSSGKSYTEIAGEQSPYKLPVDIA